MNYFLRMDVLYPGNELQEYRCCFLLLQSLVLDDVAE